MRQRNTFLILIAFCLFSASAIANNFTVTGAFDGTESTMASDSNSCDDAAKRIRVAGTISVASSGIYTVIDAGNYFPFNLPAGGIADTVIMIYAGSFDSNSPATNRVASVDISEDVQLDTGISYTLVVQHWCEEINGAFAIVIDGGQGIVSGDGFTSPPQTIGKFDANTPSAYFADVGVSLHYKAENKTVSETGTYYFTDIGQDPMILRVYEGSFDPQNTGANLLYNSGDNYLGSFSLEAGVTYVFVLVEYFENSQNFQYVLFPPEGFTFNPGLNGAWVAPGIRKQGVMIDVLSSADILFFAHFTFDVEAVVAVTKVEGSQVQTSGNGNPTIQAYIGADDQRWFTAFGSIPESGNMMTISYENSTGGRFNSETPEATQDSEYGTGYIEGIACDHLIINWNLPGGVVDTRDYYKATQDTVPYCNSLSFNHAAPVSPEW